VSMPFYISPEQTMRDKGDYAQQVVDGRMRSPDGPTAPLRAAS